jgi:hypothetical protein
LSIRDSLGLAKPQGSAFARPGLLSSAVDFSWTSFIGPQLITQVIKRFYSDDPGLYDSVIVINQPPCDEEIRRLRARPTRKQGQKSIEKLPEPQPRFRL